MSLSSRKRKKLWLPPSELQQHEAEGRESSTAVASSIGNECAGAETDELDEYMRVVEQEAKKQAAECHSRSEKKDAGPGRQKSMAARRDEGLQKPIDPENKGYKMLAMMGYKGDGPDPIAISLKSGKTGLGVEEQRRKEEKAKEEQEAQRLRQAREDLQGRRGAFRDERAHAFMDRKTEGQLRAARQVCETLDRRNLGLEESYMWLREDEEENEEEQEESRYEPGVEDFCSSPRLSTAADRENQQQALQEWRAAGSCARLKAVLEHLRATHLYCFFCGCDYPSLDAMDEGCPGPAEEDH